MSARVIGRAATETATQTAAFEFQVTVTTTQLTALWSPMMDDRLRIKLLPWGAVVCKTAHLFFSGLGDVSLL